MASKASVSALEAAEVAKATTAAGLNTAKEHSMAGIEVVSDVASVVGAEVSALAKDVWGGLWGGQLQRWRTGSCRIWRGGR